MAKKFIITTTQVVVRKYYVEVDDYTWAHDGIVMNELEEFAQFSASEDVVDTNEVGEFPNAARPENVNGAVMVFNYDKEDWDTTVRWDLK